MAASAVTVESKPVVEEKPKTLESDQEEKLSKLYPPFAKVVRCFILDARAQGMPVAIFCGLRTFDEQKKLYFQGRDVLGRVKDKSKVVTNAPAGMSMHNYGLAVDVVFDADAVKPGWQWSWDNKHPWRKLADLSKSWGLEPAYYWKSFPEGPHHELETKYKTRELFALYQSGGLASVWKALDDEAT